MKKGQPIQADETSEVQNKLKNNRMFANVIGELNINTDQWNKRKQLILKIEQALSDKYKADNRLISYIIRFGHPKGQISSADISPFDTVLSSVDKAEELNVMLSGPGGDGSVVEKMVEMCRDHLPRHSQKLRVIVPNIAKSAATVFALGADTIVMGYCSEIGPIDPQVPVVNSGITQYISALAYVEARDSIMKKIDEATKINCP
jgi:ClpP class serine protease